MENCSSPLCPQSRCGDLQPLGIHMQFGGGHAGFIATRDEKTYVMEFPSRLFGITTTSVKGEYGFGEKEITDFIDYWIPRLTESEYYIIYPQDKNIINSVVDLSVSIEPDNILRLFYVIKETNTELIEINSPEIENFNKEGFYITEWGVIL